MSLSFRLIGRLIPKSILFLIAVLLLLVLQVGTTQAQETDSTMTQFRPSFEPTTCPGDLATLHDFRCGYLVVPEDHQRPSGKTIRLMVAIARSKAATPAPDPVVMLAGGPGGRGIGSKGTSLLESAIRERRDIVYLDQRGTGRSEPSLACPELDKMNSETTQRQDEGQLHLYIKNMRVCRDRLIASGINLKAYTSAQNAADVDGLRQVLGYAQINLWGTSYGTRLGLTIIRDFPTGIRSAVLDSVYPPAVDIYRDTPANADRVFRVLFDRCATDVLCNLLYPDLRETFLETYERLKREPAEIPITNPITGGTIHLTLSSNVFANGVFFALYDSSALRYLPAMIYAVRNADYDIIKRVVSSTSSVTSSVSYGMMFSVQCSEEASFSNHAEIVESTSTFPEPMRMSSGIFSAEIHGFCAEWPVAPADSKENAAVAGNTPVLILSGEHDPVTPPNWGLLASKTLPNSFFFEFPGVGHGVAGAGSCPTLMATEFLNDPQRAPNSSCIADMPKVAFVILAPATRPVANAAAALFGVGGTVLSIFTLYFAILGRREFTWRTTWRLVTWLPIVIAGVVVLIMIVRSGSNDKLRFVELAIPAALAIQAAVALAPGEDRTLEVLVACPRPVMWLPIERLAMPFAAGIAFAVAGSLTALIVTGEQGIWLALLRWIPPALFFTGLGIFVTVRSRHMVFGALVTVFIWGGAILLGDSLLPGQLTAFPLNYLQPFFWIFHPYLQPTSLTPTDYVLNRIVVAGLGVAFAAWAMWRIRDTERLLFGMSGKQERIAN